MSRLTVDHQKRCLVQQGKPFFYQADTLWMAFSKLELNEWEEILQLRRMQRYTVVQISALPISHDNSKDDDALMPFERDGKGGWDFERINDAYFDKACRMLEMAVRYGLKPCIHLLWVNYLPDTWAAKRSPETVIPLESMLRVAEYITRRFLPYEVLYSVSGDTSFESERICEHYRQAIKVIRREDPKALITLHLQPHAEVPLDLGEMIDFYTFQGGHTKSGNNHDNQYRFAEFYWNRPGNKPVINTEPPYDGHGFGHEYGRHGTFDIRRAMWHSLLSGAQAGITYGAHGLWSMHRAGQGFTSVEFSGHPFDWRTSLRLEGAWEPGFIRDIWERFDLFGLVPMGDLKDYSELIRLAATDEWYALYVPYPTDVRLPFGLSAGQEIVVYDLATKRRLHPEFVAHASAGLLVMPQVNADVLYLIRRK